MTELKTIKLSQIAEEASEYVDEVPALDPTDDTRPVIVASLPSGGLEIVDGFHRTAGLVRWCRENDATLDSCEINVVLCDDDKLVGQAGNAAFPRKQQTAIDAIYELAGVDA